MQAYFESLQKKIQNINVGNRQNVKLHLYQVHYIVYHHIDMGELTDQPHMKTAIKLTCDRLISHRIQRLLMIA